METLACIETRRSWRKFLNKDVPSAIINKLIDAARNAPFGGPAIPDCQVWSFIIIRDAETKKKLAFDYEDRRYIASAPVIIAVCVDASEKEWNEEEVIGALAAENILLAAHDLGLGACFVDVFIRNEKHKAQRITIRKVLDVPENVKVLCLITIGYPDLTYKPEKKVLKEVDKLVHHEKW